jgi:hypothetical protein
LLIAGLHARHESPGSLRGPAMTLADLRALRSSSS